MSQDPIERLVTFYGDLDTTPLPQHSRRRAPESLIGLATGIAAAITLVQLASYPSPEPTGPLPLAAQVQAAGLYVRRQHTPALEGHTEVLPWHA